MINKTLFKQTMKANFKLWLIFTMITSLLMSLMVSVFDPSTIDGLSGLVDDTVLSAIIQTSSFEGVLASTFFGIYGVLLPVVFIIMTANSLICAQIDSGSMAYTLSTPTKRSTVVMTQGLYLIAALTVMFTVITSVGLLCVQLFQDSGDVNLGIFLTLNLGLYLLMFATSGISFFFSCLFNLSKHSLALGGGIPIAFFLMGMMSTMTEGLEFLRFGTINTLFSTDTILSGDGVMVQFIVLILVGITLYVVGMKIFEKKDLPL